MNIDYLRYRALNALTTCSSLTSWSSLFLFVILWLLIASK